jgi:hypothetical protein
VKVKDAATSAAKFVQRASAAGPAYTAGVQSPKNPWAASTVAAANTYSTAVTQAVADNRFQKGVTKAGDQKWAANSAGKGAQRYPQGVQGAQNAYQTGVQPYLSALAGVQLPPRGPKGDPNNTQRVAAIATALRAIKVGAA